MKEEKGVPPEQVMASLFEGRERLDQMALLARLEHGGASIYRAGPVANATSRRAKRCWPPRSARRPTPSCCA